MFVGLSICLHQLLDEVPLMTTDLGTNLCVYHNIITLTFFSPVMFGFILGLWVIQSLGSVTPGSIRDKLTLVAYVSGWTSHWLAILTVSVPRLSQHISEVGQPMGQR